MTIYRYFDYFFLYTNTQNHENILYRVAKFRCTPSFLHFVSLFYFYIFFFFSFFEVNAKEKPSFVAKETHVSIVDRTLSCQSYAPPSRLNSFF